MHFFRVKEQPAIDIPEKGIIGKGIPQPGNDVVKFPRFSITLRVVRLFVPAEIKRRIRICCGDDVPAGATIAEVIE
ncbi:hypothetical protein D3C87_1336000 [compost metagenome]